MDVGIIFQILISISAIGFLAVVYFAFKLSAETKNEKYWLSLAFAALFIAVHQWFMVLWELHLVTRNTKILIEQGTAILGAALFLYAVYGLYSSMKKIRKEVE